MVSTQVPLRIHVVPAHFDAAGRAEKMDIIRFRKMFPESLQKGNDPSDVNIRLPVKGGIKLLQAFIMISAAERLNSTDKVHGITPDQQHKERGVPRLYYFGE